ncbi:division/cell wall cluster transcriptional repressor MraZ [Phytoactinopolyspora alkaliphila]|uniref:Transcriptional regulator MraZ n=1 Tax=Phytoactinopolyspora alkaliphila TaxID=1783498 RepID=A0A6N9YFH6_9ACTN|nr:division/cell wall cluster transcriptional repressor MraZ [Phytoactinopolyspora alkaliphila]NED93811.1 division/cell wall cluster transcriptional repressor MraZ [Phytoactinopolyspora alkaliphila]
MFLGTHTPRLDDKGRLFLPAKFREDLAEGVVITRGQERCLYVWPRGEFLRFTEQLRAAPFTHKGTRDFARMLAAGASDEIPDKQGRITIPTGLRTYAGLEKECTVVGAMTRVEIWSSESWETYQAEKEPMFSDISEEVLPGIF